MFFLEKKAVFLCLLGTLSHCSLSSKRQKIFFNQDQKDRMDQALSFMSDKEFLKGAEIYDELLTSAQNSSSKKLLFYNAGVAYKEAGHCQKALNRLQKLLDRSLKDPVFKARGLMEISLVYECLGKKEPAFMSLKDLSKFRSFLPWDLNQVIYPARLAIAQARLGQKSKAESYKSLTLTRILEFRKTFSSKSAFNEKTSRIFYLMGRSYVQKKHIQPESFFEAFPYHQLFLLQALFLNDKTWSKLSKKELDLLFDKLFFTISKIKDKPKHKKPIVQALAEAQILIKREKSKKWLSFYSKKAQKILNLFPPPSK